MVQVADNGSPPLSTSQAFNVTVLKTNNAPSITIPGDGVVTEGSLFTFTATAADADIPAQQLSFSLNPVSLPTGATINPSNGVFTWIPSEAQGPGAYTINVRVTDGGSPPLSNSASITIIVNESNTPPAILAISDRTVGIGETITFAVAVTDPDLPAQQFSFDFPVTPPAGATLDPTNGLFAWTANTEGTNTFYLRATDNGSPSLSDTRSFDVIVTRQLQFTTISVSNGMVNLQWSANAGRTYDLLYKDSLSETNWGVLVGNIQATTNYASTSDSIGNRPQRIYRVQLQP
jgi:hypothetical protein